MVVYVQERANKRPGGETHSLEIFFCSYSEVKLLTFSNPDDSKQLFFVLIKHKGMPSPEKSANEMA